MAEVIVANSRHKCKRVARMENLRYNHGDMAQTA